MKLTVKRDELLKALSNVQSVVERRNAIPILSNVKIETVGNDKILLRTTDLDMMASEECVAVVEENGITTISVITLFDIARKAVGNPVVSIQSKDGSDSVLILADSSEFNLPSIPAAEFPDFEINSYTHNFSLDSAALYMLLSKTRHAVYNEETRYYLNGVYLHTHTDENENKTIRAVATDGHRLAKAEFAQPEHMSDIPGIIVPKKAVAEVIKLLESFVGNVEVMLSEKKITFKIGSAILSSKLIDGKFPDYERVIPKNNKNHLEVSRENLARSIDLVISVSNDKTRAVTLNIAPKKLTISATSDLNGNARGAQEIPANCNSLEPVTIGFNSKYVLDSLAAIDGNNIRVSFATGIDAVIAQDTSEESCVYVLMPMQV